MDVTGLDLAQLGTAVGADEMHSVGKGVCCPGRIQCNHT